MTRLPRVPKFLVAGLSSLTDLFLSIAINRGLSEDIAHRTVNILPLELKGAPCFLDRLTGKWRYDFGNPFDNLPGGGFVFGTHMYQPVELLFDIVLTASRLLPKDKLSIFLNRLSDQNKHSDCLVEFFPVMRLPNKITLNYEVSGYGEGGKTVDWLIQDVDGKRVLLDVKNRSRDLFESIVKIENGKSDLYGTAPAPTHDTDLLFRSLENKFLSYSPEELIQGAWIVSQLKQEETELIKSFTLLDRSRIHFVILGDWREDVYILTYHTAVKDTLMRIFNVTESRRFVFNR